MLVRTLARAGRHGEARRAFRRWRDAMRAIDAPLPDPAVMRLTEPLSSAADHAHPPTTARAARRVVTPR